MKIFRIKQIGDRGREYKVFVNNEQVALIFPGKEIDLNCEIGDVLHFKIDWCSSKKIIVEKNHELISLESIVTNQEYIYTFITLFFSLVNMFLFGDKKPFVLFGIFWMLIFYKMIVKRNDYIKVQQLVG